MADDKVQINSLEAGRAACDQVKSAAQKLDVIRSTASSAFSILPQINPDMGSKFISELTQSLDDIYNFLNGNIYPAGESYFQNDNSEETETPEKTKTSGGNNSGGRNNTGGGSSVTPTPDPTPDTTPETIPETIPETTPELIPATTQLEKIDTTSLEELGISDLNGVIDDIIDLAQMENKTVDELLADDEYSDKIKETLLNSPYVPQEFKDLITDMDSSVVRLLLDYILKGNCPEVFDLNTLNLGIMYSYLEGIAEANNISVQELLEKSENSQLLKDSLSQLDNVIDLVKGWELLDPENFQEQLRDFYLGDVSEEFPNVDVVATRAYVDYLSEECDVYYEEFLNDTSYAETLKEGAVQFGRSLTFFKATSFFSDEGMQSNVNSLYDGTNYKAFGMDKDEITSFKSEIDSVASQNNTTADKLLSDSQYADTVKDTLQKSSSAKGVGSIYKNADSTVSQTVAKNLYNTSFDEVSPQQKELDELAKKAAETSSSGEVKENDKNNS